MKRIFVPTSSGSDWQRLLGRPKLHWKKGYSAMTTAACWEENAPLLPDGILGVLKASGDEALVGLKLLAALPEWKVPLPGGKRPSQTDVLAITRNEAGLVILGVEAKVEESFGPTLGKKRRNPTPGQRERISFLEGELGCTSPLADNIRYQLLHRTVSALLTARDFHAHAGVMLVQSFSQTAQGRKNFADFAGALAATPLTDDLYEIHTDGRPRLLTGWCQEDEKYLSMALPSA